MCARIVRWWECTLCTLYDPLKSINFLTGIQEYMATAIRQGFNMEP